MHLGVEATPMAGDRRGIGRYVRQVLRHAARLRPELRLTLHAHRADLPAVALELSDLGYGTARGNVADVRELARSAADLVWCPWNKTRYFPERAPLVATIHDLTPFHFGERNWWRGFEQRKRLRRFRETAARSAAILTDSEWSRSDILAMLKVPPERVTAIPLAADDFLVDERSHVLAAAGRPGLGGPYILYVGKDEERKDLSTLVAAFARLRERGGPTAELVLCGCAPRPGLTGAGVHHMSSVTDAELSALYRGATAFVFPSLLEGFGLPVLEALASGTPVLCCRAASLPEVAGEAALYFQPRDVAGLAALMARCLSDLDLRRDLAARGPAQAARFRWVETARRTLEVFDRVLRAEADPASVSVLRT